MVHPMLFFTYRQLFQMLAQYMLIGSVTFMLLVGCGQVSTNSPQFETSLRETQALGNDLSERFYHAPNHVLKQKFKTPPEQVKPWVYWYWVSDNISKTGIENDLAAMQEAGINTALIGIIHLNGKQGEVKALTDDWWEHVRFAIKKAADYNIDIGLFNSPGWSQSGGPWVTLDKSMRYLDSTEHQVAGPSDITMMLQPPIAKGTKSYSANFFQDVRVLAFKTPAYEGDKLTLDNSQITISNPLTQALLSDQPIDTLFDGNRDTVYTLPQDILNYQRKGSQSNGHLQIDFIHPELFQARSLEIYPYKTISTTVTLSAKNKAGTFEEIKTFSLQRPRDMAAIGPDHDAPIVVSFPKVNAKHFRLTFNGFKRWRTDKPTDPVGFRDIVLSKAYKLERYVEKKLAKVFPNPMPKFDSYQWPMPAPIEDPKLLIQDTDVIDITEFVQDGKLNWRVPDGEWTIVRYFMRPTGTENGPSSSASRGPEIDKLSKEVAYFHFDAYIGKFLATTPEKDRTAFKYTVVDSYEKGAQNWTDGFADKFEQRYGYSPVPFLPVYSGRVVNSVEQSERFLWDVRRLVADRVAYEYIAGLRERANQYGLKLWLENYGHWGFPGEFLQYGGQADIVSGEFWASGNLGAIELKAASSAAHIYGHKTVMSESFTSGRSTSFKGHPWDFKKRGDWSFVEGVNHTLLHVYIHQAYNDRFPGVNAWFGSEFNRNNTWFEYMGSWLDYIKRANYMMQQGKYVADIMYFIGEDAPKMTGEISPAMPDGYSYDFINAEVILQRLTFADGYYQLPDGMRFKLLVLPKLETMRPEILIKISQLVEQGGAIYGPKPQRSPSLQNYPFADQTIRELATQMWQDIDGKKVTEARYGKGAVFYQQASHAQEIDLNRLLNQLNTPMDLSGLPDEVIWSHRSSDTHEIYFIANQSEQVLTVNPSFRVTDGETLSGAPQYFNAVTGDITDIAQFRYHDGRIEIPMSLNQLESRFIVFEKSHPTQSTTNELQVDKGNIHQVSHNGETVYLPNQFDSQGRRTLFVSKNGSYTVINHDGSEQTTKVEDIPEVIVVNQPWQLTFSDDRDVPTSLTMNKLTSLTELSQEALKHYSGTVKYQTTFDISPDMLRADQQLQLDLGEVGVIARVTLNNQDLNELWSRPLTVNINKAVKAGPNTLTVEVATTWLNRIIGDLKYPTKYPDSAQPKQFTTSLTFEPKTSAKDELQQSGLIGPVTIRPIRKVTF